MVLLGNHYERRTILSEETDDTQMIANNGRKCESRESTFGIWRSYKKICGKSSQSRRLCVTRKV